MTGFVIRRLDNGSFLGYISQTDPRGKLPPWLVNKITQKFAPKVVKQLLKASEGYETWKGSQGDPNCKPWVYPEQMFKANRIKIEDVSEIIIFRMQNFFSDLNLLDFCFWS